MTQDNSFQAPRSYTSSLKLVATSYAFRCDAKYADSAVIEIDRKVRKSGFFHLGEMIPKPFTKGVQPQYLDQPTGDSVPVINTLSIQRLVINVGNCRHIGREDFDLISSDRKLRRNDVLLTVDGGVSIGKPALFKLDDEFTVDSHVVILRPIGISPLALVYLLASPLGQMQFRRAESGASGQTTVTEDDIRRFVYPRSILQSIDEIVISLESQREIIANQRLELDRREEALWDELDKFAT